MIRLLKDCIAVRIIPPKQVPVAAPDVAATGAAAATAEGDGAGGSLLSDAKPTPTPAPAPAPTPPVLEKQVARRLAKVVGVGPGRLSTSFAGHPMPVIPLKVKVGDVVILPPMLASENVTAGDGEEAMIIHECDVLAVVEEGELPAGKLFMDPVAN